jgi:hypothetical protein
MTLPIADNVSVWLVDWTIVAITDNNKMPPRDPDDDDDDDDDVLNYGVYGRRCVMISDEYKPFAGQYFLATP